MRIGFLFNHDQVHQVAHSLPIALALAKHPALLLLDEPLHHEPVPLRARLRRSQSRRRRFGARRDGRRRCGKQQG